MGKLTTVWFWKQSWGQSSPAPTPLHHHWVSEIGRWAKSICFRWADVLQVGNPWTGGKNRSVWHSSWKTVCKSRPCSWSIEKPKFIYKDLFGLSMMSAHMQLPTCSFVFKNTQHVLTTLKLYNKQILAEKKSRKARKSFWKLYSYVLLPLNKAASDKGARPFFGIQKLEKKTHVFFFFFFCWNPVLCVLFPCDACRSSVSSLCKQNRRQIWSRGTIARAVCNQQIDCIQNPQKLCVAITSQITRTLCLLWEANWKTCSKMFGNYFSCVFAWNVAHPEK